MLLLRRLRSALPNVRAHHHPVRLLSAPPPRLLPLLSERVAKEPYLAPLQARLQEVLQEQQELQELAKEEGELGRLAGQELLDLAETLAELLEEVTEVLVPPERFDGEDAVIEVVPGAGGQEAALFAEEIFNLYLAFTRSLGFQVHSGCDGHL